MEPHAFVVVDLGFGDSGKGLLTDAICHRFSGDWVVRYNGGAQAGHNVVLASGKHHCFSQIGAGSFLPRVKTYLSSVFVFHPQAFLREVDLFEASSGSSLLGRVFVDPKASVITPPLVELAKYREFSLGSLRHGTCGLGVGETRGHASLCPDDAVRAEDLWSDDRLIGKLRLQAKWAAGEASMISDGCGTEALRSAHTSIESREAWIHFREAARAVRNRLALLSETDFGERARSALGSIVFEGAQGVLLDQRYGFFPHVTRSDCTTKEAMSLISRLGITLPTAVWGVARVLPTRHGPGCFPTEDPSLASVVNEPHNQDGPHQGPVRFGHLDTVMLRYATKHAGTRMDGLVLTHVDELERLKSPRLSQSYRTEDGKVMHSIEDAPSELTDRRIWSARCSKVIPEIMPFVVPAGGVQWKQFAGELGLPLVGISKGNTRGDIEWM